MAFALDPLIDVAPPPSVRPQGPRATQESADDAARFAAHLEDAQPPTAEAPPADEQKEANSGEVTPQPQDSAKPSTAPPSVAPAAIPATPEAPAFALQLLMAQQAQPTPGEAAPPAQPPPQQAALNVVVGQTKPAPEQKPEQKPSGPAKVTQKNASAIPSDVTTLKPVETQTQTPTPATSSEAASSAGEQSVTQSGTPQTPAIASLVQEPIATTTPIAQTQANASASPIDTAAPEPAAAANAVNPDAPRGKTEAPGAPLNLTPNPAPQSDAQAPQPQPANAAPNPQAGKTRTDAGQSASAPAAASQTAQQTQANTPSAPLQPIAEMQDGAVDSAGSTEAARAPPPHAQITREIVRRAANGATQFEVRLDPPELGRVEVKLEVGRDQRVSATISADTPQALTELVRAARDIEQALQSAGLEVREDGLNFDLAQQRQGQERAEREPAARVAVTEAGEETAPRQGARPIGLERWRGVRVDLVA